MQTERKTISKVINYKEMALIIRHLRREHNLTQSELANKLGVTRTCVTNWETNVRIPDCEAVMKMALLFHVPIDYIYGMTDHRYNINVPDYFELDLSKLNGEGMVMLHDYYKYLINSEKYSVTIDKQTNEKSA